MRAPAPTFKDKLRAYRKYILASNPPRDNRFHLYMGVLDRWEHHPEAEDIWNKLKSQLAAGAFITGMLKAAYTAQGADALLKDLPRVEQKAATWIKRLVSEKEYDRAHTMLALLDDISQKRKWILSRKTQTAARNRFMVFMRAYFVRELDRPLDDVTAHLTNIVFPGAEMTADRVYDAARDRVPDPGIQGPK